MTGVAVMGTRERTEMLEATRPPQVECAAPIDETRLALRRCALCAAWCSREHDRCRRCRRAW